MLKTLIFKFGTAKEQPSLDCPMKAITVLVGPNNSGKTRTLEEIRAVMSSGGVGVAPDALAIVAGFETSFPEIPALQYPFLADVYRNLATEELRKSLLGKKREEPGIDDRLKAAGVRGLFSPSPLKTGETESLSTDEGLLRKAWDELSAYIASEGLGQQAVRWVVGSESFMEIPRFQNSTRALERYVVSLNGKERLSLTEGTQAPNWRGRDQNHLVNLLKNPDRLEVFRKIIHDAFDLYPVIDTTQPASTHLKMASSAPSNHERSSEREALEYFDQTIPIGQFSDGMKSFIGILAAILGNDHKLILVDEPEAFLHPPLARTLGAEMHRLARDRKAQVVAATHSPEFLMGCIQTNPDMSIVRLTYKKDGHPEARLLSPDKLRKMMRDPLLRSTGVLGALFHDGAIVCESDSDRAFYQEINERLVAEGRGVRRTAFLNAQNKQTLHRIIGPLREMGVAAAAIVDLDVINKGEELPRLLDAAQVGGMFRSNILQCKKSLFDTFLHQVGNADDAKVALKTKGLQLLSERERTEMEQIFFEPLRRHGIFILPCGELESWLPALSGNMSRLDKGKWLTRIFESMGDDPDSPGYLRPTGDDVWRFMDQVASWVTSPTSGIPAKH